MENPKEAPVSAISTDQLQSDIDTIRHVIEDSDSESNPHRTIIAAANIVFGLIFLIAVPAILLAIGIVGATTATQQGEPQPVLIVGTVGVGVIAILVMFSLPFFLAGWGLFKRKSWGKTMAIVAAIFHAANVPLGTALTVYTVWAITQKKL